MSSRIIVKNLPKKITPERLRRIMSTKGTITDLKLQYSSSGVFRRFAFVGFETAKMAEEAVKYFNDTFIDTSRIQVDAALPLGDPNIATPWSKYSKGSSAFTKIHGQDKEKIEQLEKARQQKALEKAQKDAERKKHFLEALYQESSPENNMLIQKLSKKSSDSKSWANDDVYDEINLGKSAKKVKVSSKAVKSKKPGGAGVFLPKVHVKFDTEDASSSDDDEYQTLDASAAPQAPQEDPEENFDSEIKDVKNQDTTNDVDILDTGRLFVRNLSYGCTEDDLKTLFEAFGPLSEVYLPTSKETHAKKGYGYVAFMIPENALTAMQKLDGSIFQGRLLHLLPAREKLDERGRNGASLSFKAVKESEERKNAMSSHNWNSLFIRPDTMIDAVAEKLGVTKSDILDLTAPDLAVKVSIAETHLIQDTKEYLERNGVVLEAFNGTNTSRSDSIILVKNIQFSTTVNEIRSLFAKHGTLGRIILPPTKSIAVVEFLDSTEAKNAFRSLAYIKFKNSPLFLEWAPMASLEKDFASVDQEFSVKIQPLPETVKDSEDVVALNTIHAKNLSFDTTEPSLRALFETIGKLRSAKVTTKKDPKRGMLSLGYGFVEYFDSDTANVAIDKLQGANLDGHALVLSKSTSHAAQSASSASAKKTRKSVESLPDWLDDRCKKLVIRNVPFEAQESEVRELFKSFAQIRGVRLPRRFDKRHRGFGFVEFISHEEARNAFETLSGTHFYGRHLVLEWAKPDELLDEISELRKRVKVSAGDIDKIEEAASGDDEN